LDFVTLLTERNTAGYQPHYMSVKHEREMRWGSRLAYREKRPNQPAFFQCGLVMVAVGLPAATL